MSQITETAGAGNSHELTATPPQLIGLIKAHIAKGDKAAEKSEQHFIAAGLHLAALKKAHAGSWADWEELLKTKVGISAGRASELMQIADGRKTVEQIRINTNKRKIEHRKVIPSFRNEEVLNRAIEVVGAALKEMAADKRESVLGRILGPIGMVAARAKAGNGLCRWVKDDGGRSKSGIADAPGRKKETGDCVARAIAIATGRPYCEVHNALTVGKVRHLYAGGDDRYPEWSKYARRRGGVRAFDPDHGCADGVYGPYLESLGWKHVSTGDQKVRLRADELPPGRLVVEIRRHLVAVVDGVIRDMYDSGGEGRVRVKGYWTAPVAECWGAAA